MNIIRHIPNTITSMNLLCGAIGVICAFEGRLDLSFMFMLAAALCDFCDGLCARMLNAFSPIGKELDSLADLVSFGLLPALMFRELARESDAHWLLTYVPLLLVVFSALRLARFNIDETQTENFKGLATPACAMIVGSFVYYIDFNPQSMMSEWPGNPGFIILTTAILCALMVSRIPMFSMKFKKGVKAESPQYKMRIAFIGIFCVCTVLVALLGLNWSLVILLTFIIYIIMNVVNLFTAR